MRLSSSTQIIAGTFEYPLPFPNTHPHHLPHRWLASGQSLTSPLGASPHDSRSDHRLQIPGIAT